MFGLFKSKDKQESKVETEEAKVEEIIESNGVIKITSIDPPPFRDPPLPEPRVTEQEEDVADTGAFRQELSYVVASKDCTVVSVKTGIVTVRHDNGYEYTHIGMSATLVVPGQPVIAGQPIGKIIRKDDKKTTISS